MFGVQTCHRASLRWQSPCNWVEGCRGPQPLSSCRNWVTRTEVSAEKLGRCWQTFGLELTTFDSRWDPDPPSPWPPLWSTLPTAGTCTIWRVRLGPWSPSGHRAEGTEGLSSKAVSSSQPEEKPMRPDTPPGILTVTFLLLFHEQKSFIDGPFHRDVASHGSMKQSIEKKNYKNIF